MRALFGFIFAPLVPGIIYGVYAGYVETASAVWGVGLVFVLLLGMPAYIFLENKITITLPISGIAGLFFGVLSAVILGALLNPPDLVRFLGPFSFSGLVTGVSFWVIALYEMNPNKSLKERDALKRAP